MEIEYGLRLHQERENKIRPIWNSLLQVVQVVPYSSQCAKATASIRSNLKAAGLPIGPYDILIAGTAVAQNMIVVTSNCGEFKRISSITVEDWRCDQIKKNLSEGLLTHFVCTRCRQNK
jgi:tRNA(fMet)-specific endonuclease VapC